MFDGEITSLYLKKYLSKYFYSTYLPLAFDKKKVKSSYVLYKTKEASRFVPIRKFIPLGKLMLLLLRYEKIKLIFLWCIVAWHVS